jgi:hypothetical protein
MGGGAVLLLAAQYLPDLGTTTGRLFRLAAAALMLYSISIQATLVAGGIRVRARGEDLDDDPRGDHNEVDHRDLRP